MSSNSSVPSQTTSLQSFTPTELRALGDKGRVIVLLNKNRVYDVTDFVPDHPGGDDLITDLANTDVTAIMADTTSHAHSESAYEVMEEFLIGSLEIDGDARTDSDASEEALLQTTDFKTDFKQNHFLDLDKPLLMQVLRAKWTKEFYLTQVHKPRHYGKGSAPIFGGVLEPLTKTPWWIIPLVHVPANMLFVREAAQGVNPYLLPFIYALGMFLWTFVEYGLHRFLFHLDAYLPENQVAFTLHFLLHGIHHYLPMDRLRLVMPPTLMVVIAYPLYLLCHFVVHSYYYSQAVFAGAYMGYIFYDCTHYFLHHKQLPQFMKEIKVYHLDHHYKDYELGFGVTSKFWDYVFGTQLVDTSDL